MMEDIIEGLPDVEEQYEGRQDMMFDGTNSGSVWTCRTCHVKN